MTSPLADADNGTDADADAVADGGGHVATGKVATGQRGQRRARFDAVERAVHWSTAALVAICGVTALALSFGPLSALVGRRELLKTVHVVAGLFLVVPFVVGRAGPWSAQLRADVRQLNRFDDEDRRWRPASGRPVRTGKFHPGQKLNAAASAAAIVALVATGLVLWQFHPFPIDVRRGATFVHDWTAFLFAFLLAGHVANALADRESLRGMVGGTVDARWAARTHPRWAAPDADEEAR